MAPARHRTATFYTWRSKYGGMEVSEAQLLKQLEEENAKLKRIVADRALDITMLKDLLGKNGKPGVEKNGSRILGLSTGVQLLPPLASLFRSS